MAIIIFLVEKTPWTVASLLLLMVALLVYPVVHFFKPRVVRTLMFAVVAVATLAFGWGVWPKPKHSEAANQGQDAPKQTNATSQDATHDSASLPQQSPDSNNHTAEKYGSAKPPNAKPTAPAQQAPARESIPRPAPTYNVTNPSGSIINQESVIAAPQTVNNFAPPERHLSAQQKDAIVTFLQGKDCKVTMMGILENVPDAQAYAIEIADAFKAGGCVVVGDRVQPYMADRPWSGIGVFYYDEHPIFVANGQGIYTPPGAPQEVVIHALESAQLGRILVKPDAHIQKDEIVIVVGNQH